MIIVSGAITIAPSDADRCRAAMLELMRESRHEPGCSGYHLTADIEHPGRFWVFEAWDSEASFEAHTRSAHLREFQSVLSQLQVEGFSMNQHDVRGSKAM